MRYKDEEKIGSGGFGEVFKTIREEDGEAFAKKRLQDGPDITKKDEKRFQREVRLLKMLDHPRIVKVVGVHLTEKPLWFVMPFYPKSLYSIIKELPDDRERADKIVGQILDGVAFAHTNGVIHRDLKPDNVLLDENEDAVITDFGLGRHLDSTSTRKTSIGKPMGTPTYMPPEQITSPETADKRADIYALGRLLYEIHTGDIDSFQMDLDTLEPALRQIVMKCTKKAPDDRYQSVSALRKDYELTRSEKVISSGKDEVQAVLAELVGDTAPTAEQCKRLVKALYGSRTDDDATHDAVMALSPEALKACLGAHRPETMEVLKAFTSHMESTCWPFDYCDTIARKAMQFVEEIKDSGVRAMLAASLLELGVSHNRWYVQSTFVDLIRSLDRPADVLAVRNALEGHERRVRSMKDELLGGKLPDAIRDFVKAC